MTPLAIAVLSLAIGAGKLALLITLVALYLRRT